MSEPTKNVTTGNGRQDGTPRMSHERVLVVAGPSSDCFSLCEIATREGYSVRFVDDTAAALQAAATWQPDLVVADATLGHSDPAGFCRQLRTAGSSDSPPHVLFYVGPDEPPELTESVYAHADDVIIRVGSPRDMAMRLRLRLQLRETEMRHSPAASWPAKPAKSAV